MPAMIVYAIAFLPLVVKFVFIGESERWAISRAYHHFAEHQDYDGAIAIFNAAVEKSPNNMELRNHRLNFATANDDAITALKDVEFRKEQLEVAILSGQKELYRSYDECLSRKSFLLTMLQKYDEAMATTQLREIQRKQSGGARRMKEEFFLNSTAYCRALCGQELTQAEEDIAKVTKEYESPIGYDVWRAYIYALVNQDHEKAIEILNRSISDKRDQIKASQNGMGAKLSPTLHQAFPLTIESQQNVNNAVSEQIKHRQELSMLLKARSRSLKEIDPDASIEDLKEARKLGDFQVDPIDDASEIDIAPLSHFATFIDTRGCVSWQQAKALEDISNYCEWMQSISRWGILGQFNRRIENLAEKSNQLKPELLEGAILDFTLSIEAYELVVATMKKVEIVDPVGIPDHEHENASQKLQRKNLAVMYYHRGEANALAGYSENAKEDFEKVRSLGFEPNPALQ